MDRAHSRVRLYHRALLAIDIPIDVFRQWAAEYEWVEEGKPYREFLVPAALVNRYPCVRIDD